MDERATLKDPELEAHYQLMFDLFATPQWGRFMEEIKRAADGVVTIDQIPDARALHFAQGQRNVFNWLLGYEAMTRVAYEGLLAAEAMQELIEGDE